MTLAFLATRAGKFAAGGLAIALLIAGFMWWLDNERDEAVEADRAKAAAEIAPRQQRAGDAAQATTATIQNEAETTNAQVRDAARNSDDPLRDGFGKLRARQARGDAPAR